MSIQETRQEAKPSKEAGYTLTELVIVIAVLGILAAAITPAVLGRFNTSQERSAALQAGTLAAAMDEFFVDVGRYPTVEEGIEALLTAPSDIEGWSGPYVRSERTLNDPWGNPYVIVPSDSDNVPPSIVSYGADGAAGGEGRATDISYP
ncbi:type II secretion systen protein G [Oceanicaulis sp. HTCC2633]|uniref:type II secretion system major pseudopilin GspG n=1 Tax=Oceanicaulis sp. HTCC2633 TaxID=314254 RepID=UPI000066D63A|nr:type II secretion system major pseudopilin GspG [Oceanicaulis sp. HTCC2633]EAP91275.1 type II secretion systen protein G [Oceanicaulis sp. HTCC2633]